MAALPSTAAATGPNVNGLAGDASALNALRRTAGSDPKAAVREAARQFESLFMQELMKSMRSATMSSGLLDSPATKLGTEMLDSQLATKMVGQPGGLSELIAKQLERQMGLSPGPIPSTARANHSLPIVSTPDSVPRIPDKSAAGFVQQHSQAAEAAQAETGIPAAFMVAQAAHETGWGKKEIVGRDGTPSHNLFGIKAGGSWKGPTVEVMTTEFVDGRAQKVMQSFRAYASHAESFADYARLMKDSPRYAGVVSAAADAKGFAQGLQRAGYATDPAYADKLGRVINTTLRLQRTLG
jgi:peptidoglycan hydrolase FlgJ